MDKNVKEIGAMKNIFLSIIIPVYNVESYLPRCLDSIENQNVMDYEIILVDDGSKDSSGSICDKYAARFQNITCVHKENGGLSDARNVGMKYATGEYIWFVDSDDYVTDKCLNELKKALKSNPCDVLVCQSKTVDDNLNTRDERQYTIPEKMYSSHEYMEALKQHPESVLFCAQFHIVRRKFVEDNEFSFHRGILHEDELWTPQLLLKAEKIYYSRLNIYFHYMRVGSIMHSSNMEKSGKSDLIVTDKLKEIYNKSGRNDLQYLRDHMADTYLQAIWKVHDFFSITKWKRNEPLKNSYYFKTKIKSLLYYFSPKVYLCIHESVKRK